MKTGKTRKAVRDHKRQPKHDKRPANKPSALGPLDRFGEAPRKHGR
jgi:hypothetical protein